jgi:epoxide hydrolase 4
MAQPSIDMCDNGQLQMVHGATHWVQHERPDEVNSKIDTFISA